MTEQIEFNLDAEYTARVAQIPGLVEIDFSVYEEWEIADSEKTAQWRAHERQRITEEISKL
jgi:hypothetical protein